ncbi:MAG: hypothetical protein FWC76_01975 [Defluviitaleaceae bacterium]|nr:hypothetical protein [Defluviitaleaceae bacterium]
MSRTTLEHLEHPSTNAVIMGFRKMLIGCSFNILEHPIAYLWNMAFIIVVLLLNAIVNAEMQSRDLVITKRNYLF